MYLKENLVQYEIRDFFINEDIWDQNYLEEIDAEKTPVEKNERFLKLLLRSGPRAYDVFVAALQEKCSTHIIEKLQNTPYTKDSQKMPGKHYNPYTLILLVPINIFVVWQLNFKTTIHWSTPNDEFLIWYHFLMLLYISIKREYITWVNTRILVFKVITSLQTVVEKDRVGRTYINNFQYYIFYIYYIIIIFVCMACKICSIRKSCDVCSNIFWFICNNTILCNLMLLCLFKVTTNFHWLEIMKASAAAIWEYWRHWRWNHQKTKHFNNITSLIFRYMYTRDFSSNVCLFVCLNVSWFVWNVIVPLEDFSLISRLRRYRWKAANFDQYSAHLAIEK